jgi:hypothetical protein
MTGEAQPRRHVIPAGLRRCLKCGEYKGRAIVPSYRHDRLDIVPVSCLCDGIACRYCGNERSIHRPTSNYFCETTLRVWHVPTFGGQRPCEDCTARASRPPQPVTSENGRRSAA